MIKELEVTKFIQCKYPPKCIFSHYSVTIVASIKTLTKLFGRPRIISDSVTNKVQFEWNVLYNNKIPFTIYDWKEYRIIPDDLLISWSIGTLNRAQSKIIENPLSDLVRKINYLKEA